MTPSLHLWSPSPANTTASPPPPPAPSTTPRTKSPLYSQHRRLSGSITLAQQPPFHSSDDCLPSARCGKSPPGTQEQQKASASHSQEGAAAPRSRAEMLETRGADLRPPCCCFLARRKGGEQKIIKGAPRGDDAMGMWLTNCERRCSSSAHSAPCHVQGVLFVELLSIHWVRAVLGGLIGGGETSKRGSFAQASFYLLKCGVVREGVWVPLRGGSRLGRAASRPARRGGGRCSRWQR